MKRAMPFLLAIALAACASQPALPIAPGVYRFQQRFAEQPSMQGTELEATIDGRHVEFVNVANSSVFPMRALEDVILLWHARSRQWIIGSVPGDARVEDVGGCSGGPTVVDLVARIYWTC